MSVVVDALLEPHAALGTGAIVAAAPRMELGAIAPLRLDSARAAVVARLGHDGASYVALVRVPGPGDPHRDQVPGFYRPIASSEGGLSRARPGLARALLDELAVDLENDTAHLSVARRASRNPAFQELAQLGPAGVRVALRRLALTPNAVWLYFLQRVTGARPAAGASSPEEAARLWREWGKQQGLA